MPPPRPSNPKSSGRPGDRRGGKRGDRNDRAPSEFSETTLSIDRVTRVVKGGRRMRFRAIVVMGNRKGKVGLGTGKATEVQAAVRKAQSSAKRNMIRIPLVNGTIPHQVELKFKAARIRLIPAFQGTGIIAGGALRVILDHAGVKDVLSKRFGSRNKLVNAQAAMLALEKLRGVRMTDAQEKAAAIAAADAALAPKIEVKEISKKDAEKSVEDQRRNRLEE